MRRIEGSVVVMPPVYELEIDMWRWCKLTEVCSVASSLNAITENNFHPTPEELISRFAGLTRITAGIPYQHAEDGEGQEKRILRYSVDGIGLCGTEVPTQYPKCPPYVPFQLEIGTPYPKGLFVREDWAMDTLRAIRLGAVAAAAKGEDVVGFPPRGKGHVIRLGGSGGGLVVRIPACVE